LPDILLHAHWLLYVQNPFAHVGYKLASRFIRVHGVAIDHLTDYLSAERTLDEQQLLTLFERHATLLSLEELEQSITN
jgi:hypothetical protein